MQQRESKCSTGKKISWNYKKLISLFIIRIFETHSGKNEPIFFNELTGSDGVDPAAGRSSFGIDSHSIDEKTYCIRFEVDIAVERQNKRVLSLKSSQKIINNHAPLLCVRALV